MSERESWNDLRERRMDSPAARAGYEHARSAYEIGRMVRELRFHLGRERRRISYYIASGKRIVLLTVFRKTKMREVQEVARAEAAMLRCIAEGHTAED